MLVALAPTGTPPHIASCALFPYFGTGSGVHLHHASRRSLLWDIPQIEHVGNTIDAARSLLLGYAYGVVPADVFVFIDSDISFSPADYERLVASCLETRGVVAVPYATKRLDGRQTLSCNIRTADLGERPFYERGGIFPASYVGMGFTAIHREVVDRIVQAGNLEKVIFGFAPDRPVYPLFMPMILDGQYLLEDYAFCERARAAGCTVSIETRPRGIRHHGEHGYRVEDLGLVSRHQPDLVLRQQPAIQKLPDDSVDKS